MQLLGAPNSITGVFDVASGMTTGCCSCVPIAIQWAGACLQEAAQEDSSGCCFRQIICVARKQQGVLLQQDLHDLQNLLAHPQAAPGHCDYKGGVTPLGGN